MRSKIKRGNIMLAALFIAGGIVTACGNDHGGGSAKSAGALASSEAEAADIATEAYIYAYPLVTMEYTRRGLTNVPAPEGTSAPMGQFARIRQYPDASFRTVTAPNADTLYTQAWFDVSKEPWIITVPAMGNRYFLLPMLDGWTDVFQVPQNAVHPENKSPMLRRRTGEKGCNCRHVLPRDPFGCLRGERPLPNGKE